jgi:hypothetical protein
MHKGGKGGEKLWTVAPLQQLGHAKKKKNAAGHLLRKQPAGGNDVKFRQTGVGKMGWDRKRKELAKQSSEWNRNGPCTC